MRKPRSKRNVIVVLIGVPITLAILIALGLVGVIGVRSTEIIERDYLSRVARQFPIEPASTLISSGYDSSSDYPSLYPELIIDCNTHITYWRVFYSDMPFNDLQNYYLAEFRKIGAIVRVEMGWISAAWLEDSTSLAVSAASSVVEPHMSQLDLYQIEEIHESVYVLDVGYGTSSCLDFPP